MKLEDFKFIDFKRVVERLKDEKNSYTKNEWINLRKKVNLKSQDDTNIFGATSKIPSLEYIVKFAKITNKPVDYYLFGERFFLKTDIPAYVRIPIVKDLLDDDYQLIYKNGASSCLYNYKWLKIIAKDPFKLICMRVHGNGMQPLIQEGDSIKIDINRKSIIDGSIYAFTFKNSKQIIIRRFSVDLNNIQIIPENDKYKSRSVKTEDINIIGQVILLNRLYIMVEENL